MNWTRDGPVVRHAGCGPQSRTRIQLSTALDFPGGTAMGRDMAVALGRRDHQWFDARRAQSIRPRSDHAPLSSAPRTCGRRTGQSSPGRAPGSPAVRSGPRCAAGRQLGPGSRLQRTWPLPGPNRVAQSARRARRSESIGRRQRSRPTGAGTRPVRLPGPGPPHGGDRAARPVGARRRFGLPRRRRARGVRGRSRREPLGPARLQCDAGRLRRRPDPARLASPVARPRESWSSNGNGGPKTAPSSTSTTA